jgi:DNA (cytosine-5)-methyltransferase 1
MLHLIRERRPDIWLGEQVASKDGLTWFDLVRDDLEGEGYAVGAVDTSSALTGAPHIRQRLRIGAKRVADLLGSRLEGHAGHGDDRGQPGRDGAEQARHAPARSCVGGAGQGDGFWRDADWLYCRDGKWRPVEPGTFPLAHGAAARVGRLRGYGNAVDAIATKAFIEAFDDLRLMSDLTTDEGIFG